MAKKQTAMPAKKAVAKKVSRTTPPKRTAKLKAKTAKATSTKAKAKVTKSAAKPALKSVAPAKTSATTNDVSLGRPLVTQEEKLYMLFHDDYQARQVFEFLRVENIKELEQFSQQQIIHMMSKPLRMTLDRIRQRLAQFKRSLKDDEHYAAEYLKHADGR